MVKKKDIEVHVRLGKILAIGTTFVSNGSWEAIIAVTAGTLGSEVNAFEHGGQVGMVFEMYRNCAWLLPPIGRIN